MPLNRSQLVALASLLALAGPAMSQPVASPGDTCHRVTTLLDNTTVRGSTDGLVDRAHASCARHALSGERVYALRLDHASRVSLRVAADYDVALYVRRACADEVSELACNDDLVDTHHAGVDVELGAGTWYVFVDGYDSDSSGEFTLSVEATPLAPRLTRGPARPPVAARTPSRPTS